MENINTSFQNRFFKLVSYLNKTRNEFEMVADEMEDSNLKTALNGLSAEASLFATELRLQLSILGIIHKNNLAEHDSDDYNIVYDNSFYDEGGEVTQICCTREIYITNAYREILYEYFPFPCLREVMMYQLNAIKCAFMKIKLLNTNRFL